MRGWALLGMIKKDLTWGRVCRELNSSLPFPVDAFLKVS